MFSRRNRDTSKGLGKRRKMQLGLLDFAFEILNSDKVDKRKTRPFVNNKMGGLKVVQDLDGV